MKNLNNQNLHNNILIFYILTTAYLCIFFLESIFQLYIFETFSIEAPLLNLIYKIFITFYILCVLWATKYYLRIDKEALILVIIYSIIGAFFAFFSMNTFSNSYNISSIWMYVSIVYSSVIILYSYYMFRHKTAQIGAALTFFFIINAIVVIAQVFGLSESLYFFQNYVHVVGVEKHDYVLFLQTDNRFIVPSEQFRPSGLFTSTIYLTLFFITYFGYLIFNKENSRVFLYFFAGLVIPFSGSTMSILIALISCISIFYNKRIIWFLSGYLLCMAILYFYLPLFLVQNFNIENTLSSIAIRISFDDGNSFFTQNFNTFIMLLIMTILFFSYKVIFNRRNLLASLLLLFIIGAPLTIHPLFLYSGYTFLIGMVFAFFWRNNVNS